MSKLTQARIKIREMELAEVRWAAKHAASDEDLAASSERILQIQGEIEELKKAA